MSMLNIIAYFTESMFEKTLCPRTRTMYTQYIKKRNTYIFVDNLSNFLDVHFKLAGYIN